MIILYSTNYMPIGIIREVDPQQLDSNQILLNSNKLVTVEPSDF